MRALPLHREVEYPESDGQPMGETPLHRREINYLIEALEERFQHQAEVYVSGNMFLYYEEGRPQAVVAPDVFVALGVAKDPDRRVYKLWVEGRAPSLVIEVTSDSTSELDLNAKKSCYERLGVTEYFLFDPRQDYLPEGLTGFRLEGGRYRPIQLETDGSLVSRTTGVTLRREGRRARLVDTATGRSYLRYEENSAVRRAAEAEVRLQVESRKAAEAEVARLRAELARRDSEG